MDEQQVQDVNGQDQLLEIYKLQAQLTNDISNRRTTTNRFYIIVMSGLALLFTNILRLTNVFQNKEGETPGILSIISNVLLGKEGETPGILSIISIEQFISAFGIIGMTLSTIWCVSLNSYLRVNSRKYEALKDLEIGLKYKFFKKEWGYLPENEREQTYWRRSIIELMLPIVFFLCFWLLMLVGLLHTNIIYYHLFHIYPISVVTLFCFAFREWSKIEKNFRKGDNKGGKMA